MMRAVLTISGWRISKWITTAVLVAAILGLFYTISSSRAVSRRTAQIPHENHDSIGPVGLPRLERIGKAYDKGNDFCDRFPDPGNIVVTVKTGATAIHERLPAQLFTSLRCVSQPLIYSDLEDNIADLHVHDVLANFTPSVADKNKDFDIYRLQRKFKAEGRQNDIPELRSLPILDDDWRTQGKSAAWSLDKYKFLHMVERTWILAPGKDWYLFIEADTYLSWPTLLRWLPRLDSSQKLYLGTPILMYEHQPRLYFAHGGAGVLLSGAAVRAFAERQGLANRWDGRISKMWFGDFVLADALHEELQLRISNASLAMNSDDASAIAFREEIWCQPVVTVHHMNTQQSDMLWKYEKETNLSTLLFRDVYKAIFRNGMPEAYLSSWDNSAHAEEFALQVPSNEKGSRSSLRRQQTSHEFRDPHEDWQACELACARNAECMSFSFTSTITTPKPGQFTPKMTCYLSRAFKLGRERQAEVGTDGVGSANSWISGWRNDRIASWVAEHQECSLDDGSWPPFKLQPPQRRRDVDTLRYPHQ